MRQIERFAEGFYFAECPRWHDGALWFCDMLRGHVNRLADGAVEPVGTFDHPTSVGFRPNGDMLVGDGNKRTLLTFVDGQLTGSRPLGLILPKIASATAVPASVLPW